MKLTDATYMLKMFPIKNAINSLNILHTSLHKKKFTVGSKIIRALEIIHDNKLIL